MTQTPIFPSFRLPAAIALAGGVFLLDLATPLGLATWGLYVFPLLLVHGGPSARHDRACALVLSVLIVAGMFASPPGLPFALGAFNRGLGLAILWGATALLDRRRRLEASLRRERDLSDSILNSLPGVYFLYDEHRRFQRWNRRFEAVAGYSAEEMLHRHPLDFFADEDRARLAERIAEVFRDGESEVEADFVAKDGRRIPYYFNGVRAEIEGRPYLLGMGIDITARKAAEIALRAGEARYRTLFEYAPDGILIADTEGYYVDANAGICRMLGYARDELIGKHSSEIVAPAEVRHVRTALDEIRSLADHQREWRFRRKDGTTFPAEVVATRMPDGRLLGMVRDIGDRKRAEKSLADLAAIVESSLDAIVGTNLDGTITSWNPAAAGLFGHTAEEVLGRTVSLLVPPDRRDEETRIYRRIERGERVEHFETLRLRRDGSLVHVSLAVSPIRNADGEVVGAAEILRDVTESKAAEERLRRVEHDKELAETADRIKSAFLATMSHELRTPLNSIIGFTGILLQGLAGPLNDEQNKQLDMVRGSARHLLALINDVLDISKIEAGQLEVAQAPFDVPKSVAKALAVMKPLAERKNLALHARLAPELGTAVGDERRFEQILLNLLGNAVKFTERGEVALTADVVPEFVARGETVHRTAVRVRVADTGCGIKPEDLATLFRPFRQLDAGLARNHEGTGLGLVICRRLAHLMGGEVHAASAWQRGSTFEVVIPAEGAAAAEPVR